MEKVYKNKEIISLFVTTIVFLAIIAGVFLIQQRQDVKVVAQESEIRLVAPSSPVVVNSEFNVDVYLDPKGQSVTGLDLKVKFNTNLLEFISAQERNALPVVFSPGQLNGDTVQIILGSNVTAPMTSAGIVVTYRFKALTAGTASFLFNNQTAISGLGQSTNIVGAMNSDDVIISGSTNIATNQPINTSSPTNAPSQTLSPTPTPISTTTPSGTNPTGQPNSVKMGDLNGDGIVNIVDIGIIIDNYGQTPPVNIKTDLNLDGTVNIVDIGIIIDNYEN